MLNIYAYAKQITHFLRFDRASALGGVRELVVERKGKDKEAEKRQE